MSVADRARPRVRRRRLRMTNEMMGWACSLPLILVVVLIFAYPAVNAFRMTLLRQDGSWLGFARYGVVSRDPVVLASVRYTIMFTVSVVALHLLVGLVMALLLTLRRTNRGLINTFRGILILPWVVSLTVTAAMIRLLLHPLGLINYLLKRSGVIIEAVAWLAHPVLTPWLLIAIAVWSGFPLFMIMFIGAIQSIPVERYEAAIVDGANRWQTFRHITLPGATGVALRLSVLDFIWSFKTFNIVYLLTRGGPVNRTSLLSYFVYQIAFNTINLNYASTIAMFMALVSLVVAVIVMRIPEPETAATA